MGRDDFMAEVADFTHIQNESMSYCKSLKTEPNVPALEFEATKWNPGLTITSDDCKLILSSTGVRQELRDKYDKNPNNLKQPPGDIPGC